MNAQPADSEAADAKNFATPEAAAGTPEVYAHDAHTHTVSGAEPGSGSAAQTVDAASTASSTGSAVLTMENAAGPPPEVFAVADIPDLEPPALWMVGEGASPNVWWRDCSQPFANVLEAQMAARVPVARYVFYGNLAAGPVSFLHDFRDMTQLNQNTGQRKRLRRVQEINAAVHPHRSSGSCPLPAGRAAGATGACDRLQVDMGNFTFHLSVLRSRSDSDTQIKQLLVVAKVATKNTLFIFYCAIIS